MLLVIGWEGSMLSSLLSDWRVGLVVELYSGDGSAQWAGGRYGWGPGIPLSAGVTAWTHRASVW